MIFDRPLVALDFEATGIDRENDRIVEFALVKLYPDGTIEKKTKRVNPGIPIPAGASEVHGIYDQDIASEPLFKSYAKNFVAFIEGCDLVTFNGSGYDLPLMYNELLRAGIDWDYTKHRLFDASNIFRILDPRTLTAAFMKFCGKELVNSHSALADTEATLEVFQSQLKIISEMEEGPKTPDELNLYSNHGKKMADLAGKFVYDDDGDLVINFAKPKGTKAKNDPGFLEWIINKDFSPDTKRFARQVLREVYQNNDEDELDFNQ